LTPYTEHHSHKLINVDHDAYLQRPAPSAWPTFPPVEAQPPARLDVSWTASGSRPLLRRTI